MDYVTREHWSKIFALTSEAIIFINDSGSIELMNPAAEKLIGYSGEEAVGKSIQEVFLVEGQTDLLVHPSLGLAAYRDSSVEPEYIEVQLTRRDGEIIWISCSFTRIASDSGGEKLIIFARNINEAKKAEQMRSDFISIASHELRTPLTVIAGYLSLLIAGKVGKLQEQQSNFIKQIYDDTQSLSSLVEDLLDVSRLDSGKFRLHKSAMSLYDISKKTIDSLTDKALERNITIVYTADKVVPPFHGDKAKIRQVLTNIVDNAIKYTNPSGKIRVSLKVLDNSFVVTVIDNGYGIEKKDLPHIFERFYRSENKLLDRVTGAGLGLYISKTIIEMHEGSIVVDSTFEKGTTFTISLPRDLAFERGQTIQPVEKAPNAFQQFLTNFLHGKRRKE
ncbi:MAG: cell wall metabolism sensor histidine kinase WalK [bacterium]|nr:cell wall metabolism sensor histidine kinase WalK [bacterium]